MKIGLDFDGVITDCGELKRSMANKLYGIDIPEGKLKKEIVVGEDLLSLEQYRTIQKAIYNNVEVGLQMKAVPGMFEGLKKILEKNEVSIVTSRDADSVSVAKAWMKKNNINLPITGVGQGVTKAGVTKNFDVFIDDDLEKLISLVGTVPKLYLFSWPYNMKDKTPKEIIRIANWQELISKIE